eukprot:g6096.t1
MKSSATPVFKWSTLDISKGPSLPREAERVVKLQQSLISKLNLATTNAEKEVMLDALDALRTSIEHRVEELEDFYIQHDSDERSILFMKQRLKLRRLLHNDVDVSKAAVANTRPPPKHARPQTAPTVGKRNEKKSKQKSAVAPSSVRPSSVRVRKMKKKSVRDGNTVKSYEREPRLAYSTNKSLKQRFESDLSAARAKMKSRVEPIYSWETPNDAVQQKVQLFGPVEFQLRLTEQEFYKFCSKRRERAALLRHKKRNVKFQKKECQFLNMQGPYVDPPRILNSIYRCPDKSKWIDPKGIRGYLRLDY